MESNDLEDLSPIQERTSLCESESSSVANMNYSGPGSPQNDVKDRQDKKVPDSKRRVAEPAEVVVIFCNTTYIQSCAGLLRLLQVILSLMSLISLTLSGRDSEDFLMLPLSWHFRVMLFVLILTLTTSLFVWLIHSSGLVHILLVNWYFIDMVVYSVFSFLYLVGSSLVASAFDFYQKMGSDVPDSTIHKLIFCVVIGYICMFVYGLTALVGYRRWKIQHRLFKRRRLLEEDEEDI